MTSKILREQPDPRVLHATVCTGSLSRRELLQLGAAAGLAGGASIATRRPAPIRAAAYGQDDPVDRSAAGGRLVTALDADVDSLDPHHSFTGWRVWCNIYDPIIELNQDLEFEPLLAESWEISEDGLEYTVALRKGLLFHDGTEVNAAAVKFSNDRAAQPDAAYPTALNGATTEVVDEYTVKFTLEDPYAAMLFNLSDEWSAPLSPAAVAAHGDAFGQNPVGAGPFRFQEWVTNERITLVPFEEYQDFRSFVENPGPPFVEELTFRVLGEEQSRIAALETNEINILLLPGHQVARFESDPNYYVLRDLQGIRINYVEFALVDDGASVEFKAPLDDLRVRQAIAHGINVDDIILGVLGGNAQRNFGLMPHGSPGYNPDIEQFGLRYDADRARQLLDEAGWVMGSDGVRQRDGQRLGVVIGSVSDEVFQPSCVLIQNQLQQLGFDAQLTILEPAALQDARQAGELHLDIASYGWGEQDIVYWLGHDTSLLSGLYGNRNADYSELTTQGWAIIDPAERAEIYFEAEKLMLADAAVVPLFTTVEVTAVRSEVRDFTLGPQGRWSYQDAYIAEG